MTPAEAARPRSRSLSAALVLATLAFSLPVAAQAPEPPDASESEVPFFLRGVELALPSQEAFRDWPGEELRQRAYWLPWSWRSFQRARLFDRPVFFVLRAAWSRNSQRLFTETLADPTVMETLNAGWTTILVDADRRPDIRERYQTGTWPVVAFLLPDGNPMLSQANPQGTAQPITTGRVDPEGLLFLLGEGRVYYDRWRNVLQGVGEYWAEAEGGHEPAAGAVNESVSDELARWLLANADRQDGGFGAAPKFVHPGLADYGAVRDARLLPALMDHARTTVERTAASRLYDAREGGVHRLAGAPGWKRIQWEKMLGRNADFLREIVTVLRMGGDRTLEEPLRGTARFLLETLGRPGGGFYNAQMADPGSPGGGGYWKGEGSEPPPVDRTVLAGPNARAGAALLRAAAWLDDADLEAAGRAALDLVLESAYTAGRGVDHVVEPAPDDRRYLETQAEVALALIDAFECTGEARYLDAGEDLVAFALANLADTDTALLRDHLPDRIPVGILANARYPMRHNVRIARALLRLDRHGRGDESRRARALEILGAFAGGLTNFGTQAIEAGLAVEEAMREPLVIALSGRGASAREMRRAALNLPWGWVVVAEGSGEAPASVRWRGETVTVDEPDALAGTVRRLTGVGE